MPLSNLKGELVIDLMIILKNKWKSFLGLSIFSLLFLYLSFFLIQENKIKKEGQQLSQELSQFVTIPAQYYPESIQIINKNQQTQAIKAIENGASYGQEFSNQKLLITRAVYDKDQLLYYISIERQISSNFSLFLLLSLFFFFFYSYTFSLLWKTSQLEINSKLKKEEVKNQVFQDENTSFIHLFDFPLFILNSKGKIISSNLCFQKKFTSYTDISDFSDNIYFSNFLIRQMLNKKKAEKKIYFNQLSSYFFVSFHPLKENYFLSLRDISSEEKILNSQKELIANISHELKTPLSSIHGFSDLLRNEELTAKERQTFSQLIHQETERLLDLVADILLLTRKPQKREKEEFEPSLLIKEILGKLNPTLSQKELQIQASLAQGKFITDRKSLYIILKNLIENAIFYTENQAKIQLSLDLSEKDELIFSISNPGQLTEIEKERLFERFFRGKSSGKVNPYGTGLGLSIVQKNIQELSASLLFESKENKVKFQVTIPQYLNKK
ncbi:MAG: sensor histidine kinase [Lactovum sp.]